MLYRVEQLISEREIERTDIDVLDWHKENAWIQAYRGAKPERSLRLVSCIEQERLGTMPYHRRHWYTFAIDE